MSTKNMKNEVTYTLFAYNLCIGKIICHYITHKDCYIFKHQNINQPTLTSVNKQT